MRWLWTLYSLREYKQNLHFDGHGKKIWLFYLGLVVCIGVGTSSFCFLVRENFCFDVTCCDEFLKTLWSLYKVSFIDFCASMSFQCLIVLPAILMFFALFSLDTVRLSNPCDIFLCVLVLYILSLMLPFLYIHLPFFLPCHTLSCEKFFAKAKMNILI